MSDIDAKPEFDEPHSDLIETVMDVLMGDAEEATYAEIDQRFFDELDRLHLTPTDEDTAVGAWIAVTDHVIEDRRDLTPDESKLMASIFERIILRHGYLRMVGTPKGGAQ